MKTICIYHSVDLDGWMSAAIVKKWFIENNSKYTIKNLDTGDEEGTLTPDNEELHFLGRNYGQPLPNLIEYDKIILVDVSFTKGDMEIFARTFKKNFIWIDHHISMIREMVKIENADDTFEITGIQDDQFAACELTWKYFFPKQRMPNVVRLLGRYDCFGFVGTDEETEVLEFQYGARALIKDIHGCFLCLDYPANVGEVKDYGRHVYTYAKSEGERVHKRAFKIMLPEPEPESGLTEFIPRTFLCVNQSGFNPGALGIKYAEDGYCVFYLSNKKWHLSLYSDKPNVDCSAIAKLYGGGGHKGAAGIQLELNQFDPTVITFDEPEYAIKEV